MRGSVLFGFPSQSTLGNLWFTCLYETSSRGLYRDYIGEHYRLIGFIKGDTWSLYGSYFVGSGGMDL